MFAGVPTLKVFAWSPFTSLPSASVGSATVSDESTLPCSETNVLLATLASTSNSNVMVSDSPKAISPTFTVMPALSSRVPFVVVADPAT